MSQPAIQVEGLWKEYVVGQARQPHGTFYDLLASGLKAPLRRLRQLGSAGDDTTERFWALRDLNFAIQPGEVVGVIGRNGAGKSTLLKILSRITAPTRGRITVRGRLASLLEVGTGFHAELSGRENIYLNGSILGMSRAEVARKFDEIVAFAEVDKFIDTPVKRYSSGMYVRLAFAVAAHLETDVLLVDEVLAVGDAAFQRKSLGKMSDVARHGRTVLFVSHNLSAVRNLCGRAIYLEDGGVRFFGETGLALSKYESRFTVLGGALTSKDFQGPLGDQIACQQVKFIQDGCEVTVLDPLAPFSVEISGVAKKTFAELDVNLAVFRDGFHLSTMHDTLHASAMNEGEFVSSYSFPADIFRPGRYTLSIGAYSSTGIWMLGTDVATVDFSENLGGRPAHRVVGAVAVPHSASRTQTGTSEYVSHLMPVVESAREPGGSVR